MIRRHRGIEPEDFGPGTDQRRRVSQFGETVREDRFYMIGKETTAKIPTGYEFGSFHGFLRTVRGGGANTPSPARFRFIILHKMQRGIGAIYKLPCEDD